jgi:uncharacterized protein (UPF0297 family)
MESFDFKKYHVKAMNASSEEEKAKINQELKDVYASLDEEAQKVFNEQLQTFLVKEYAAINSLYQGASSN